MSIVVNQTIKAQVILASTVADVAISRKFTHRKSNYFVLVFKYTDVHQSSKIKQTGKTKFLLLFSISQGLQ